MFSLGAIIYTQSIFLLFKYPCRYKLCQEVFIFSSSVSWQFYCMPSGLFWMHYWFRVFIMHSRKSGPCIELLADPWGNHMWFGGPHPGNPQLRGVSTWQVKPPGRDDLVWSSCFTVSSLLNTLETRLTREACLPGGKVSQSMWAPPVLCVTVHVWAPPLLPLSVQVWVDISCIPICITVEPTPILPQSSLSLQQEDLLCSPAPGTPSWALLSHSQQGLWTQVPQVTPGSCLGLS